MLEWKPHPLEVDAQAKGKGSPHIYKAVSGPWTIAKWTLTGPYALWRGKERWPKQFGFVTAQEAKDLAEKMEREGK